MPKTIHVIHLTPGTGAYHCGLCLRDHELTLRLRDQGMTVTQVPLYLPLYTDTADDQDTPIFFGAVNSWLQQQFGVFRKTPRWIDAVFDKRPILMAAAKRADTTTAKNHGDMAVSMLQGKNGRQLKELQRLADWLESERKPDLIVAGTALLVGLLPYLQERLNCRTACALQGEDAFIDDLPAPWSEQAWAAVQEATTTVDAFIAPSNWYADHMAPKLGVPRDRIQTIYNGIDLSGYAAKPAPAHLTIGFFAHLCPPKGLHLVVDAFIRLHARPEFQNLRLHAAGSLLAVESAYVDEQKAKIEKAGLTEFTRITPNVTRIEKIAFLQDMTVLSVPATYGEAFGLYLPEAWAAGIPTVQPDSGAFRELTELSQGGIIYDPSKPENLAEALANLLLDPQLRDTLSQQGRNAAKSMFDSGPFAERIATLYASLAKTKSPCPDNLPNLNS